MDSKAYRPGPQVLERLKQVDFVAVVGPTAAGKTTLIRAVVKANPALHPLVAGVSRPARAGERDGVDFHFADKETMEARARRGEYVTVVTGAAGDLYTTAPEDYWPDKTVVLAVLAHAVPLFRSLPFRSFKTIFSVPPDWPTWQERISRRNFTPEQLAPRLKEAKQSLRFALQDDEIQFVINGDLEKAIEDFNQLLQNKPLPRQLQRDQTHACAIVRDLLERLG